MKHEQWTESEVIQLSQDEHDYLERKGGEFFESTEWKTALAKALCALANSAGGHLILGVEDNGSLSGVEPLRKATPTREWLEQVIPTLLSPPLSEFRVHQVVRAEDSKIPQGRCVIVIDVSDSALAPHQTEVGRTYFYREGGRSVPAPHFYLEALRNRLTVPVLEIEFAGVRMSRTYTTADGRFIEGRLRFRVENIGRVAAYHWAVLIDVPQTAVDGRLLFDTDKFPNAVSRGNVRLGDITLLPSLSAERDEFFFGIRLVHTTRELAKQEIASILEASPVLQCRVVGETSPGQLKEFSLNRADVLEAITSW